MSYTYVVMSVSQRTYDEIKLLLEAAGYQQALHEDPEYGVVLDMKGIAIGLRHDPPREAVLRTTEGHRHRWAWQPGLIAFTNDDGTRTSAPLRGEVEVCVGCGAQRGVRPL